MAFTSILDIERSDKGVSQLPDSPLISSTELKALFDSLGNLAIDKFITHINEISAESGAGNIGAVLPEGFTGSKNIQSILNQVGRKINSLDAASHQHINLDVLNGLTEDVVTAYNNLVDLLAGIEEVESSLTNNAAAIPTSRSVYQYIQSVLSVYPTASQLFNTLYPVGTVYNTTSAVIPFTQGTWTLITSEVKGEKSIYIWERTA